MLLFKSLLLLALCFGYLAAELVTIQLPDGKVMGRTAITATDKSFFSFQGIPYAQPPVGKLRFQAPQPVQPWDDVIDATHDKNICYQVTRTRPDENEDCLFVNVYTPQISSDAPLPVMFFIYGGGFVDGSSDNANFGPHHFMDHDVILVTFNYRVGPFGFASTGDSAIPGNAGLKDQNMALQWVQKNIKYFGGDPDKVTIFGESAGAASVAYQIISPKSKGLFRAGICESGSALSAWAFQQNQVAITYETASYLNPSFTNGSGTTAELLKYLQSVPASDLDNASRTKSHTESTHYIQIQQGFFWTPVIEHDHADAFITKGMYEYLNIGEINKVPLIIGYNSEEAIFYADNKDNLNYAAKVFDEEPALVVPLDMHIVDDSVKAKAAEEIREIYVPGSSFTEDPMAYVAYHSDQSFVRSVLKHAELQSAVTDVYLYEFAYTGVLGQHTSEPVKGFSNTVRHGEELSYLFSRNYGGYNTTDLSKYPEMDQKVSNRFITLFTNFAKTLNPTPEQDEVLENIIWPKVDTIDFAYLVIGSSSEVRTHPKDEVPEAWDCIYEKYGEPPYDAY